MLVGVGRSANASDSASQNIKAINNSFMQDKLKSENRNGLLAQNLQVW